MDTSTGKYFLLIVLMTAALSAPSHAQMTMNPYFSVINYPIDKQSFMFMVLPDYQSEHSETINGSLPIGTLSNIILVLF